MQPTICPTVTAEDAAQYKQQMERIEPFAQRIHVDVSDGQFAPRKLLRFDQIWWRGNRTIDLHVMYKHPVDHTEIMLALNPRLIIVHAEAEGNFPWFAEELHRHGIEVGLSLLPSTTIAKVADSLPLIDHLLIFSGNLGHFGGEVDLGLLSKVKKARELKPTIEIGWDGGVSDQNAAQLAAAGVDVLNTGGFVHNAVDPAAAYQRLVVAARGVDAYSGGAY
jgi:ribulose-phosphate 3-epimerase